MERAREGALLASLSDALLCNSSSEGALVSTFRGGIISQLRIAEECTPKISAISPLSKPSYQSVRARELRTRAGMTGRVG